MPELTVPQRERLRAVEAEFRVDSGKFFYDYVDFSRDGGEVNLDGWFSVEELLFLVDAMRFSQTPAE